MVGAVLDDPAPVDHVDHVSRHYRGQTVGYGDGRSVAHERLQRHLDVSLARRVERRRGLVENQDARVVQDDPGDREPLALSTGQPVAALPDNGVVPVWERIDPVVDVCGSRGGLDLSLGGVGPGVQQIAPQAGVEQVALLRHVPDHAGEGVQLDVADVHAVDLHCAFGRIVQPRNQVRDGGLTRTARTDERCELTGLNLEVHVVQRPSAVAVVGGLLTMLRVVRQLDRVEGQATANVAWVHVHGVGTVLDVRSDIQVAEDALEQRHRRLQLHRYLHQVDDGEVQPELERSERDDGAGADVGSCRAGYEVSRDQVDDHWRQREEDLHHREERLPGHLTPYGEVGHALVLVVEALDLLILSPEQLGEHDAGYRERLLGDGRDLSGDLLRFRRHPPPALPHEPRYDHENRNGHDGHRRQLPREDQHCYERADEYDRVGKHAGERVGDDVLHAADIVRDPGLYLAGARSGEEAERLPLEV